MNISLFANNTTFGVPYISPPESFTAGSGFGQEYHAHIRHIRMIPVPEKRACFANPIFSRVFTDGASLREDVDFEYTIRMLDTDMVYLNPELRFMPAEIFSRCEPIPLKSLANRHVAVVASDTEYQTLVEVGEQNRRQSFYHSNTRMHPELCDERIAELARLGFFRLPDGSLCGFADHSLFNISMCSKNGVYMAYDSLDLATSNGRLPEYKHLINNDLLRWPIIEIDQVAQAACVSSVYSPTNKNHLMLIRPANTKLPMLQGTELFETKYQAIIDRATDVSQPTSIEPEQLAKSLWEAEFFMAPYQKAIRFCQSVIGELGKYQQEEYPNLFVAIDKAISQLAFSEQYMTDCSNLVRQAIVCDELIRLESSEPIEDWKKKQEENRKQLIHKEVEWLKKAVQQEILPRKTAYFPMIYMHSLSMVSLGGLLMDMGNHDQWREKALHDKITDWKTEAQTICAQTDELMSNLETLHSLKRMSILVSVEDMDSADDI
ncbi:hypothetical protein [Endozoicomonas sp. SCSIO W0465]|uniref:hypothetical protein n=1 Tax=Endozoicomonas sp. SCSIO W0465 TaxID=2918516 RepID=UPI0020762998|nr:hypothetical protein [Endozoicomonas sp. SCSIO W0465]USE37566.1 hypothetical protein MJO57_04965 [Endozoicomonas sp. SCSIO W0465]